MGGVVSAASVTADVCASTHSLSESSETSDSDDTSSLSMSSANMNSLSFIVLFSNRLRGDLRRPCGSFSTQVFSIFEVSFEPQVGDFDC